MVKRKASSGKVPKPAKVAPRPPSERDFLDDLHAPSAVALKRERAQEGRRGLDEKIDRALELHFSHLSVEIVRFKTVDGKTSREFIRDKYQDTI
eukprot:3470114-Lingulodinium_polyedra.AAC.1